MGQAVRRALAACIATRRSRTKAVTRSTTLPRSVVSTMRAIALPTTTASAKPAIHAACSGALHAEADADGKVGLAPDARHQLGQLVGQRGRGRR